MSARSPTRSGCSGAGRRVGGDRPTATRAAWLTELGLHDDALALPDARAVAAGSASSSRSPPASRGARTCCCSTSPRRTSTCAAAPRLERLIDGFDGAVVMVSHDRHLLDECVDDDRRARPRAHPHLAGRLLGLRASRASSSSSASSRPTSPSRRRSRAWRRRSGASSTGRTSPSTSARRRRRASSRCRSTAWTRSTGRCSSAARWRSRCAAPRAAASAWSRSRASTSRFGEDPVLLDVELTVMRGERVGVVGPNGAGKIDAARACSAAASSRRPAPAGSAPGSARLPLPGRGRDAASTRAVIDALRARPLAHRGGRGAAADGLPVRLRADAPAGAQAVRRRAHAARLPAADAGRAELPAARRADQPPRHRLDRGARGRARALRRDRDRGLARPLLPRPDRRSHRGRGRRRGRTRTRAAGRRTPTSSRTSRAASG